MKEMPGPIPEVPCMCAGSRWVPTAEACMCSISEAALIAWENGKSPVPMTPEQRQWCIDEIRRVGDSTSQPDNFDSHTDADLGRDTPSPRSLLTKLMTGWTLASPAVTADPHQPPGGYADD